MKDNAPSDRIANGGRAMRRALSVWEPQSDYFVRCDSNL